MEGHDYDYDRRYPHSDSGSVSSASTKMSSASTLASTNTDSFSANSVNSDQNSISSNSYDGGGSVSSNASSLQRVEPSLSELMQAAKTGFRRGGRISSSAYADRRKVGASEARVW
jgi:hypothetical protein